MVSVATQQRDDGSGLLRSLHDEHGQALWRYVLSLTGGNAVQAQDVVQETFLRAWRNPQAFRPERGSPRAWLYAVARRVLIDEHRSAHSRHEAVRESLPEQAMPDASERVVDRELLRLAMSRLSQEHRDVLRECYFRGSSVSQAADALGVAPGTVKSRTHYALRSLRAALGELGGIE